VQLIVISAQLFFLLLRYLVNCQHVRTVTEFGGSSLQSPQALLHEKAVGEGEYFQQTLFLLPSQESSGAEVGQFYRADLLSIQHALFVYYRFVTHFKTNSYNTKRKDISNMDFVN
jgi:hypothetical protein